MVRHRRGIPLRAMTWALAAVIATCIGYSMIVRARSQGDPQAVYVGPNIRVSTDSEKSHFEPMLAAADNGVLVASSNLTGGDNSMWITKGYVSRDNGNTWFSVWIPAFIGSDRGGDMVAGDSAVATGAFGRLFYAALVTPGYPKNHDSVTYLYRSDDKGHSWPSRVVLGIQDHERFVTDPQRRWVLLSGKGTGKPERLVAYISYNNGTTFSKPLTYAYVTGIAFDPYEFPDGSVFLPFVKETRKGMYLEAATVHPSSRAVSKTFLIYQEEALPVKAIIARSSRRMFAGDYADQCNPVFLGYRNTLYSVDCTYHENVYRLVLRTSTDRGHTWSAPRYIAPPHGKWFDQFAPAAAVNAHGVVGIVWSEMVNKSAYDERFTASLDGGKTFLPARIISTHDSMPWNDENVAGMAFLAGKNSFFQASGFTTRTAGGDYFGMAADTSGAFHPLWIDSRDGVGAQVYTTTIALHDPVPSCPANATGEVTDLSKTLQLVFDPVRANMRNRELILPIRLRNTGNTPVTGPVTLTVTKLQSDEMLIFSKTPAAYMPHIVGAANGKTGVGATFDFSHAFGDFGELPPHGVSNPVDLRLHLSDPVLAEPVVTASVTGRRCSGE